MTIRLINTNWGYQICDGTTVIDIVEDETRGPHRSWIATRAMIDKVNDLKLSRIVSKPKRTPARKKGKSK